MRAVVSDAGFRERLVQFWTNHFTVVAKNLMLSSTIPAFIDDAIRPHIAGNFSNLLTASYIAPRDAKFFGSNLIDWPQQQLW